MSENGELVEAIDDGRGGHFLATAFVKAQGGNPWQMEKWDETLFERYGRLLGRIHALSKDYQPANLVWKRLSGENRKQYTVPGNGLRPFRRTCVIELKKLTDTGAISDLKQAYLASLVAPLDGYWQAAIIDPAPHWEMAVDGRSVGYFAADDQKRLLQFYTTKQSSEQAADLFAAAVGSGWVETAVAGTNDPAFLSLCLDVQKQVSVHTYLFYDARRVEPDLPAYPWATFQPSTERDLERLLAFYGRNDEFADADAIESNFGNQRKYVQTLIANQQSFILKEGGVLLGIGEYRRSASQPPYADIGMIVDKAHRRRGVGVSILTHLKAHCASQNAVPICSCAADNIASRKTIEKAGFAAYHRLVDVVF